MTGTEKREYLIRTLSRTKRKDYENYVIGAIWHRLNNLEIKPVSQQYVKRADGKHALLDLYFPQINVGIECDEAYHEHNTEPDKIREANVEQALSALQMGQEFTLIRINANTDMNELDRQINDAVDRISGLYKDAGEPKWSDEKDPVAHVSECDRLSLRDNLQFAKIVDIAKCFGREYKAMQASTFFLDNHTMVWCPKLAIEVGGETENGSTGGVSENSLDAGYHDASAASSSLKAPSVAVHELDGSDAPSNLKAPSAAGWLNVLSDNWDTITTIVPDSIEHKAKFRAPDLDILVFAQSKNSLGRVAYRFLGVYRFEKSEDGNKRIVYRRVAEEYRL